MSEEQAGMVPDRAPPEGSGPLPVDDANAADGHVLGDRADLARAFADSFAKDPQIFGGPGGTRGNSGGSPHGTGRTAKAKRTNTTV